MWYDVYLQGGAGGVRVVIVGEENDPFVAVLETTVGGGDEGGGEGRSEGRRVGKECRSRWSPFD